ncbi:MAG TPA: hypothetical protein VFH06_04805 [Candidatus Saccharimonadales bacterium]|nr:hypothetical protein [Candidatus Saccharimonadales bacterium]
MNIDPVGWSGIILVGILIVGLIVNRIAKTFGKADTTVSDEARITRDIELEPTALAKIDTQFRGLGDTLAMTGLRNMLAWNELPSYITEEVVEQGIDAVERLIERTSYQRTQAAHTFVKTGLVTAV